MTNTEALPFLVGVAEVAVRKCDMQVREGIELVRKAEEAGCDADLLRQANDWLTERRQEATRARALATKARRMMFGEFFPGDAHADEE